MLESCVDHEGEGSKPGSSHNPIVIGQAVEFLQALLDMMTEQNIHLEVNTVHSSATPPGHVDYGLCIAAWDKGFVERRLKCDYKQAQSV